MKEASQAINQIQQFSGPSLHAVSRRHQCDMLDAVIEWRFCGDCEKACTERKYVRAGSGGFACLSVE